MIYLQQHDRDHAMVEISTKRGDNVYVWAIVHDDMFYGVGEGEIYEKLKTGKTVKVRLVIEDEKP